MRHETKGAEAVVEGDDDGALLRQGPTVMALFAAESGEESTAVNPHQHRSRRTTVQRIRPDIQVETILRHSGRERIDIAVRLVLHAVVAEVACRAHALPPGGWLRRLPSQRSHRRRGVGNSAEYHHLRRGINDSLE